jgi:hypothetical protein
VNKQRDVQRSRVYRWENKVVAPHDPTVILYHAAQPMVNAIWSDMGLKYPPAVEPLSRSASATIASANRLTLFLPEQIPSWCLLHELAHAMTTTSDGLSDGHGKLFVGIYVQLLTRYLRLDIKMLASTLHEHRTAFIRDAKPIFSD